MHFGTSTHVRRAPAQAGRTPGRGAASDGRGGSALEEVGRERAARDLQVLRHVGEDAGEGAEAETRVIGDGDVMLAALLRGEPEVAPGFPRHSVPIAA